MESTSNIRPLKQDLQSSGFPQQPINSQHVRLKNLEKGSAQQQRDKISPSRHEMESNDAFSRNSYSVNSSNVNKSYHSDTLSSSKYSPVVSPEALSITSWADNCNFINHDDINQTLIDLDSSGKESCV